MDTLTELTHTLETWITEMQQEVATMPDGPDEGLWKLSSIDEIEGWRAQLEVIGQLLANPEQQSENGLECLLREQFKRYDAIDSKLATLPNFDYVGDEITAEDLTEQDAQDYRQVDDLQYEQFLLQHRIDIVATLAGISERRAYEVRAILCSYHGLAGNMQDAPYYPLVSEWLNGQGTLKTLAIPGTVADWYPQQKTVLQVCNIPALVA